MLCASFYNNKKTNLKDNQMKKQTKKDKAHEHLAGKHGAESKHKQSMKDRMDEMKGAKKKKGK